MMNKKQKFIDFVLKQTSIKVINEWFGDIYQNIIKIPEIKEHIDYLSKGSFTIKTDHPHRKLVKFNFKIEDFVIESEDGYVDIYLYVDLLIPKNLPKEEKLFVAEWVQSYNQDDPIDVEVNDSYFNDRDVWIRVIKVNGERVSIPLYFDNYPADTKLFDLFNIPYQDENHN